MRCADLAEDIREAVARGSVPAALLAHLDACAGCRAVRADEESLLARIDGILQTALQTQPRPEVARRVRARSAQPATVSLRVAPRWLLAAASLAAVAAAIVALRASRSSVPAPALAGPPAVAARPAPPVVGRPDVDTVAPPRTAAVLGSKRLGPRSRPGPPPEPLVLVPPGEQQALLALYASMRQGMALPPAEPEIRPLAIAPLVVPAVSEEPVPSGVGPGLADSVEGGSR